MIIINEKRITDALTNFKQKPFNYCVIDNFFRTNVAKALCKKFPKYSSNLWHEYKNEIEDKKTCNNWNHFDELTYQVFTFLNSNSFVDLLSKNIKIKLFSDPGLHGGGWHIHANNGNLNPHLDYTIHPKMKHQRRLNLIIYLEESYKDKYGGHLGFWSHDKKNCLPKNLIKEIYPKFNRAVIFDTSQNSWHGLSTLVKLPRNKFRKSIAVYYLSKPKKITYLTVVHYLLYEIIKKNQKNLLILFEKELTKNHIIKCINNFSFFLFAYILDYIAQKNPLMQSLIMKDWFYPLQKV